MRIATPHRSRCAGGKAGLMTIIYCEDLTDADLDDAVRSAPKGLVQKSAA